MAFDRAVELGHAAGMEEWELHLENVHQLLTQAHHPAPQHFAPERYPQCPTPIALPRSLLDSLRHFTLHCQLM